MNYHCWRNAESRLNDNSEITWPKLPQSALQERETMKIVLQPEISRIHNNVAGTSQTDDSQKSFDPIEYPKLEEIVLRQKSNFVNGNWSNNHKEFLDSDFTRLRKLKICRSRSTDLIHINLQKTLEEHRWPLIFQTEQPIKITVDVCKLNVNMSVGSPLDGRWPVSQSKRSPVHVAKKKKRSRLKWLIMYERMARLDGRSNTICSAIVNSRNIPEINFDKLKINLVTNDETDLVKKMSTLTCLNMDYRNKSEIEISEDTATAHPDLHERMESLSLEKSNDRTFDDEECNNVFVNVEPIDCDAMNDVLSFKLCDETDESTNNIAVKEESGRMNYSKKFREYCTNTLTPGLKNRLQELMAEMSRLQKKLYDRDNVKGRIKRRYYAGMKEVHKHMKKIKFVVIAPNLEKVKIEGGLDDAIGKFIRTCKTYDVPYCFGLDRRKLGYYVHGKGFVSCIGIANYSGAEEKLKNVLFELVEARNVFARLTGNEAKTIDVQKLLPQNELILSETINAYLKILASNS